MEIFSGKWAIEFDKEKGKFDLKKDILLSNKVPLYPGRFYVLEYMSKTEKPFNTRPVIISLGISQKDPESFLCIDLCDIPKDIRIKFVEMFFDMFSSEIAPNMRDFWEIKDADKQSQIKKVTYQNLMKVKDFKIIKTAVKKYKIKNIKKIYSLLFNDVYKVIGDFCDVNMYLNGKLIDVQKEFLKEAKKIK